MITFEYLLCMMVCDGENIDLVVKEYSQVITSIFIPAIWEVQEIRALQINAIKLQRKYQEEKLFSSLVNG